MDVRHILYGENIGVVVPRFNPFINPMILLPIFRQPVWIFFLASIDLELSFHLYYLMETVREHSYFSSYPREAKYFLCFSRKLNAKEASNQLHNKR